MERRWPARSGIQGALERDASAHDRNSPMACGLRQLRQHVAAVHRIFHHELASRSDADAFIAARLKESLCALARTARTVGLTTYCSLTLHVLEQLSSAVRTRYVPRDFQALVFQWAHLSWLYLIAPTDPDHAANLVAHMGDRRWERRVCRLQRDQLLVSLRTETLLLANPAAATDGS